MSEPELIKEDNWTFIRPHGGYRNRWRAAYVVYEQPPESEKPYGFMYWEADDAFLYGSFVYFGEYDTFEEAKQTMLNAYYLNLSNVG